MASTRIGGTTMTTSMMGSGFAGRFGLNKVRLNPEQMTAIGRPAADPAPAAQSVSDRMDAAQAASANVPAEQAAKNQATFAALKANNRLTRGGYEDGSPIYHSTVLRETYKPDPRKIAFLANKYKTTAM